MEVYPPAALPAVAPAFVWLSSLLLAAVCALLALALVRLRSRLSAARRRLEEERRRGGDGADGAYDPLTGLPHRGVLIDRLRRALERSRSRPERPFAVLSLDLDSFKVVNDSLGHPAGDRLLLEVAHRLERLVPPGDTVARVGGDEFVLLLEALDGAEEARGVAERVQGELSRPLRLGGQELAPTAAIGIVLSAAHYQRPEELLRDAEIAMYRAKSLGRAKSALFDTTMQEVAMARMSVETALRRALERGELRLHYQPIVSLATGRISGFEALLRWAHPDQGLLEPKEFLEVARQSGLMEPVSRWVLREACRQTARWNASRDEAGALSVSVNLFSDQLTHPDFPDLVAEVLEEAGLPPEQLCLELTEDVAVLEGNGELERLAQLKARRLQLHMDDFGTGYSSLSSLHKIPLDRLKIDRSFIHRLVPGEDPAMIDAILLLAHSLGLAVVAEGVETREQLDELRQLGCEYAQGFFLSPAMPANGVTALLRLEPRW